MFYSDSMYQDGIELSFDQGFGILVKTTGKSLRCIVIVPPEVKNRTAGLLGSWNGNPDDDLRLDDGTILSQDSFGEDIVNSFGTKCELLGNQFPIVFILPCALSVL